MMETHYVTYPTKIPPNLPACPANKTSEDHETDQDWSTSDPPVTCSPLNVFQFVDW